MIVLEFNELTPVLMDRFIGERLLPGFERLRNESLTCITNAEEAPFLEPWIQWVTVHTGLSRAEHGVNELDDGPRLRVPRVWDIVSDAGKDVWVCGSMNAGLQGDGIRGLFLPDPWTPGVEPHPRALFRPYHHFVRTQVLEHTRDSPPLTRADHLRFVAFMMANGLSARTMSDTLRQLASECGGGARWRRATILDRVQWDVFRHHHRRLKPALATFFLNSTAHYQHYYWRNMEPERFDLKPGKAEQAERAAAIRFGYRKMDEIVRECLDLAGRDTTIVLCTALGQQPLLRYDAAGGKQLFRPTDPAALMRFAGIAAPHRYAPVMAENAHLHFESENGAEDARRRLVALRLGDGTQVMDAQRVGARLTVGCLVNVPPPEGSVMSTPHGEQAVPFRELFYQATGVKSGMHHPDGLLWIRTPRRTHMEVARKVSLREVAPTLLGLCGIDVPAGRFAFPPMPEVSAAGASDADGRLAA